MNPCCRSAAIRSPTTRRTQGDAVVRKTQLGPGSTHGNRLRGSCYEVGENRPACRSTTGRPGERRNETRELRRQRPGMLREGEAASQLAMADRRVVKLRPVPQEPCRRREEPASVQGAPRPGCPRGRSERRSNRCECVLRGDHRESKARSYAAGPGSGGRESSRFLGTKRWKKPETASIIARTTERREGPGRAIQPPTPKLLAPT